ncbi:hypothetical protein R1flu_000777 [Riccia fluitans]|uniref:Protein kinase domain-containing protein n=1 Tax=Riccia fluitans TaxID=41844 RepID=A0ABD1Y4D1_9MARC
MAATQGSKPRPAGQEGWRRNGILAETRLSTIFLCTNLSNNKQFVAKTALAHDLEPRTALEIERRLYKGYKPIDSPYIINYLGFTIEKNCEELDNQDVCSIFLEWVPRGSLYQFIHGQGGDLPEQTICIFSRDILKGLAYLHGQGKIHGDVKASNILIGKENLKLCDLGSGKINEDGDVALPPRKGMDPTSRRIFTTGSDGFRAPEVENETNQGPPADIYAFGCTLVEMATGDPPQRCPRIFQSTDPNDVDPETGHRRCSIDLPTYFSKEAFDVLAKCLAEDPRDRPSAEQLLQHPWFKKFELKYPLLILDKSKQDRRLAPVVNLDCGTLAKLSLIGC